MIICDLIFQSPRVDPSFDQISDISRYFSTLYTVNLPIPIFLAMAVAPMALISELKIYSCWLSIMSINSINEHYRLLSQKKGFNRHEIHRIFGVY